jgi:UDP-N-acetylglucosamine--N-acetylmuramyl-(pentapeptide) pyrophosphoryl-undecaprenol N-acetylglucosamine transferase
MNNHILFVGGGTAGHTAPLLAVIEAVYERNPHIRCSYVGLKSDIESPLLKESPFPFERHAIVTGKLNRYLTLKHLAQPFRIAKGLIQAYRLLKRLKPDVIFSKGGFVSVPIVLAAQRLHIPVISHETDVVPGLANRLVAEKAQLICTAFPVEAYTTLPAEKLCYTGQPVREIFRKPVDTSIVLQGREVDAAVPLLTIIGGSQGAHSINFLMRNLWSALLSQTQIIHICGQRDYEELLHARDSLPVTLQERLWVTPFILEPLPALFQRSRCVVSRAGGTLAELAASHAAVVLIPLSTASQDHQRANARVFEAAGAAYVFDEETGTEDELHTLIERVLQNEKEETKLREAMAALDRPTAAGAIAEFLLA